VDASNELHVLVHGKQMSLQCQSESSVLSFHMACCYAYKNFGQKTHQTGTLTLQLRRQRYVDEGVTLLLKLRDPLITNAISEHY